MKGLFEEFGGIQTTATRSRRAKDTVSKAAIARQIVRDMGEQDQKSVVDTIQTTLSFNRAMARHYFYCARHAVNQGKFPDEKVDLNEVLQRAGQDPQDAS